MGVFLGLLAGITYGAADFIGGLASRRSSTLSVVVLSQFSGLVALLALLAVLPRSQPSGQDLVWGLLAGVGGAAGITLLYRGLSIGRMSVVSPITAVIGAIIPFSVGLLMRERPSIFALIGVAIALLAVVLVSASDMPGEPASNAAPGLVGSATLHENAAFRDWTQQPGLIEAVLAGIGVGAFYVLLARTHAQAGLWPLTGARFASIVILITLAFFGKRSLAPKRGSAPVIAFAGVLDMLANAFYLLATKHGLLALVAVLASLYPASTVVLARFILHERLSRLQLAGVAGVFVAIALIAWGTQ